MLTDSEQEFNGNLLSFEFIYRYWSQLHTKHENLFSISLESEERQGRE